MRDSRKLCKWRSMSHKLQKVTIPTCVCNFLCDTSYHTGIHCARTTNVQRWLHALQFGCISKKVNYTTTIPTVILRQNYSHLNIRNSYSLKSRIPRIHNELWRNSTATQLQMYIPNLSSSVIHKMAM